MKFEQAIEELKHEAVSTQAVEQTVSAVFEPHTRRPSWLIRRGLPLAVGMAAVGAFALYPWRKSDQIWAQAKAALANARIIHMKLDKTVLTGPCEVWIHGDKVVESWADSDVRYNGKVMTKRFGQIASVSKKQSNYGVFMQGYTSFETARQGIEKGDAKRGHQVRNGQKYSTYEFDSGMVGFSEERGSKFYSVAKVILTAFVDDNIGRIVRIEQRYEPTPAMTEYLKKYPRAKVDDLVNNHAMVAIIDYPETIDDTIFDPPANAFDEKGTKEVVAKMLATTVGEQTVNGQTVKLHGIMFDGGTVNVIWSGTPADFESKDRFSISGLTLGQVRDQRCFSSGKYTHKNTAKNPYCQMGAEVKSVVPGKVDLTLPVFAPDPSRPYPGGKGVHSKCVGTATFKDVPITYSMWLGMYERQFGLVGAWW